jgi:hypothetical protein
MWPGCDDGTPDLLPLYISTINNGGVAFTQWTIRIA